MNGKLSSLLKKDGIRSVLSSLLSIIIGLAAGALVILLVGLFNFGGESCTVALDDVYADMLGGELRSHAVELPGYGFAWLEQEL